MNVEKREVIDALIQTDPDFLFRDFSDFIIFSVTFILAFSVFLFQLVLKALNIDLSTQWT